MLILYIITEEQAIKNAINFLLIEYFLSNSQTWMITNSRQIFRIVSQHLKVSEMIIWICTTSCPSVQHNIRACLPSERVGECYVFRRCCLGFPLITSVVGWNSALSLLLKSYMWCSAEAPAPLAEGGKGGSVILPTERASEGLGKNEARCGCSPSGGQTPGLKKGLDFLSFLYGLGRPKSKRNDVRIVGNLEMNCWVQKKLAKSCHKVRKACLDCLQKDFRLRGAKPSSASLEWTYSMAVCPS